MQSNEIIRQSYKELMGVDLESLKFMGAQLAIIPHVVIDWKKFTELLNKNGLPYATIRNGWIDGKSGCYVYCYGGTVPLQYRQGVI